MPPNQLRIWTECAAKQELVVAGSYTDHGISGARLIRPGATPDAGPVPALKSIKWLRAKAERNMPSINAEIIRCLRDATDHEVDREAPCPTPPYYCPGAAS